MYKLAAELRGHDDDVRAVAFPNKDLVISASRDATVRQWTLTRQAPPTFDGTLCSHGQGFIASVGFIPPSHDYPSGLIVSGAQDGVLEVRQPGKPPEDNAERLLLGHTANVCALDISEDRGFIVSGSWDCSARIWPVGKWETTATLQGHEASVWAVLAFNKETVVTACADKFIRVFHPSGKLVREWKASEFPVRALCRLPTSHASGAHLASAGNDNVIRLWTLEGQQRAELHGHENFVYSLAVLPTGELVSSGEDRTARIWQDGQCIQTITHPAISVWAVAVCPANGDIVTGASDRTVRVFTREQSRQAEPEAITAFDNSVKSSSIPKQGVEGGINQEQLPGPEFLERRSGTKEGQVQMIREANGNITAHQWSTAAQQWLNVGTVVDSVGSSGRKQEFQGQDYDYVFDVDIEDGKPPLKLPYNLSQNPYDAATKFIADNELPVSYLDQVANFIITNTQGASIGQQTQAPGSDPWGTGSRYRPGDAGSAAPESFATTSNPKVLPQTQYLDISTGNLATIQKKIEELNQQLLEAGSKDVALNPEGLNVLAAVVKQLQQAQTSSKQAAIPTEGIDVALTIATKWPADKRLPGLDLLRLIATGSSSLVTHTSSGSQTLVDILASSGVFSDAERPNNIMLGIRTFANLFHNEEGRLIMDGDFDKIQGLVESYASSNVNRNLTIALTTLYINYAVLLGSSSKGTSGEAKPPAGPNADRALTILDNVTKILKTTSDTEALYRALVAAGTFLSLGEDFRTAAREVFDLEIALQKALQLGAREERIKGVVAEIRDEMARE